MTDTDPVIHRVVILDLAVQRWRWPFAEERRAEIDTHFTIKQRESPKLWNGRLLLGRNPVFAGDRFSASYFETDFASLLAWRDWGFPDRQIFNGFGMGALRGNDGVFVLGEMGQHTANPGRVYFPSGTPDLDDIVDGVLDMSASIAREAEEETGLSAVHYRPAAYWDCVVLGTLIAIIKVLSADVSGQELRDRIEANLARQDQPELSAVHLVRDRGDFTAAMPRFVTAFLEKQLAPSE